MAPLLARQDIVCEDDGECFEEGGRGFWYTTKGQEIRWLIFLGILALFIAFMAIGHWHARKRLSKGLRPLGYHRWMLSRQQRATYDPAYQNPTAYYTQYTPPAGQYGMNPMPPPVYDNQVPPTYQPPAGATKIDPSQWRSEPTRRPAETGEPAPDYAPPAGPPPANVQAHNTGVSEASNNPYRL